MTAPPFVVVDDDHTHALMMRTMIGVVAPGTHVTVHTDPRDVGSRLLEAPRDAIVLIDRLLDRRESYELITSTLGERPDLHVAVVSAALSDEDRARALRAGADVAVEKPGSIAGWRALFGDLLARCRPDATEL